jgi:hypothetical protein
MKREMSVPIHPHRAHHTDARKPGEQLQSMTNARWSRGNYFFFISFAGFAAGAAFFTFFTGLHGT